MRVRGFNGGDDERSIAVRAHTHKTLQDLINLQEKGALNLEPGFQRKSVWAEKDRRKLIESILVGYPVPSIFLYKRVDDGQIVFDVLDGKQRLESVFMYTQTKPFARKGYAVPFQFEDDERAVKYLYRDLCRYELQHKINGYKVPIVEVSGDLGDIVELFVRINSTGKALTTAEKRKARFYTNPILREAQRLAAHYHGYLREQQIVNPRGLARMRDVELMTEGLPSILHGGVLHQKSAIDRVIGNESVHAASLARACTELRATMTALQRLFPELHATRFKNSSEFYSLFMVCWELVKTQKVLTDKKRNRNAMELLRRFSDGVDRVKEAQRKVQASARDDHLYAEYLLTVAQSTDKAGPRERRQKILRGLFDGLFEHKDEQRTFSAEQRRLLWNGTDKKACSHCGEALDWTNFQVDHVVAHSRGGRTAMHNAALICQPCNGSKGARKKARSAGRSVAR